MKKVILAVALACMLPAVAMADRGNHHREHRGGGFNPWPFVAGAVIGGIIVHEADRDRERQPPPRRYITVCENIMLYDARGTYIKTERHCHEELADY